MTRTTQSALFCLSICCALLWSPPGALATSAELELSHEVAQMLASRPALRGRGLAAADLGGRAVVVSFFASWCPPCHAEFKHLAELRRAFAGTELAIVAINQFESFSGFDDGGERLQRFLDRHAPKYFVIAGNKEIATRFGGVARIPTVFVFDRRGRPVYHFVHQKNATKTNPRYDELHAAVASALDKRPE